MKKERKESESMLGNFFGRIIQVLIGWTLFYFGGWNWVSKLSFESLKKLGFSTSFISEEWDVKSLYAFNWMISNEGSDLLLKKHSIFVRINESYYGVICDASYFDSPVIQWCMLFLAFGCALNAIFNVSGFFMVIPLSE